MTDTQTYGMTIHDYIEKAHQTAVDHGWWDTDLPERTFGDQIALMHSELSEALEHFRDGNLKEILINDAKPDGVPVEFADVLIRIFDTCGYYGIDLEQALTLKMAYNDTRPFRHGGRSL